MANESKRIQGKLNNLFQDLLKRDRKCYYPGCEELAINSHILDKNGILRSISTNNHLFCLDTHILINGKVSFKKIGINKALSFKGFCENHDNYIFKDIENGKTLDFDNYRTNLLLSYRGVLNELRKKEINNQFHSLMLSSGILTPNTDRESLFIFNHGTRIGIKDAKKYKLIIENDLNSTSDENFIFKVHDYPKLDVCTSAFYTKASNQEMYDNLKKKELTLPPAVIFNLIPRTTESKLILGFLKVHDQKLSDYIKSFNLFDTKEQLKKISDFLLINIETWVCSPNLYHNTLERHSNKIIDIFCNTGMEHDSDYQTDFNMFEDLC